MANHKLTGDLEVTTKVTTPMLAGVTAFPGGTIASGKVTLSDDLTTQGDVVMTNNKSIKVGATNKITVTATGVTINGQAIIGEVKIGDAVLSPGIGGILYIGEKKVEIEKSLEVDGNITASNIYCSTISCANKPWVSTEGDPVFTASPAFSVTTQYITNWNNAFAWGNHSDMGYLRPVAGTVTVPANMDLGEHDLAATNVNVDSTLTAYNAKVENNAVITELKVIGNVGFYGTSPKSKQTVTGATTDNKLTSLINALVTIGLIKTA